MSVKDFSFFILVRLLIPICTSISALTCRTIPDLSDVIRTIPALLEWLDENEVYPGTVERFFTRWQLAPEIRGVFFTTLESVCLFFVASPSCRSTSLLHYGVLLPIRRLRGKRTSSLFQPLRFFPLAVKGKNLFSFSLKIFSAKLRLGL